MTVYTFQAENYCAECGEALRARLPVPEGADTSDPTSYDSDDYPKPFYGDNETDNVEHCAAGENCANAVTLLGPDAPLHGAETRKVGAVISDVLTDDGCASMAETVRESRRNGTPYQKALAALWVENFPDVDTSEPEAEETEPTEGDYTLSPCGRLGGKTAVGIVGGKFLGEFADDETALAFVADHGTRAQFFPAVWNVSDHGNAHLVEGFDYGRNYSRDTVRESCARSLWVSAFADALDRARDDGHDVDDLRAGAGDDWHDVVPDGFPDSAGALADTILRRCEEKAQDFATLCALWVAVSGTDSERLGHVLAMVALGHGVGFDDDVRPSDVSAREREELRRLRAAVPSVEFFAEFDPTTRTVQP